MEDEIFLDNECFHCGVKPSSLGHIADGLACDICMKNAKLAEKKIGLHMPKIKVVMVTKVDILRATTAKNFNFDQYKAMPQKLDDGIVNKMKRWMGELQSSQLVKRNMWSGGFDFFTKNIQIKLGKIEPRNIKLVPFQDVDKPVVYMEQVFQICVADWDGDCVLKDDINGVEIIRNAFTGDELYDSAILSYLSEHPVNRIMQIMHDGEILHGTTPELQLLVNLFYSNFRYI